MAQLTTSRLPSNYRLLLEIVERGGRGTHRSTAQIYDAVRAVRPGMGFSTVARGLARLTQLGLIMPVRLPNGSAVLYEPAGEPHAHFACDKCGCALDVDYAMPRAELAKLSRRLGVSISVEEISFRGLCKACGA